MTNNYMFGVFSNGERDLGSVVGGSDATGCGAHGDRTQIWKSHYSRTAFASLLDCYI